MAENVNEEEIYWVQIFSFFFFFLKITNIRNGDIYRGKDDVIVEQMDRSLSILFSKIEAQIMAR